MQSYFFVFCFVLTTQNFSFKVLSGGAWSDNSRLWTPSLKKAVNFVSKDDGAFWMCFEDFVREFFELGMGK